MPRSRCAVLPLAFLLTQSCTSIIVVGDRDDAAVTNDQPVTLDHGPGVDGPDVQPTPDVPPTPDTPITDCIDRDGDHYGAGLGCINVDCDDANAAITDQCYCDRVPNVRQGCLCRLGDAPLGCDLDTGLSRGAENVCNLGQRNCEPIPGTAETGQWSACRQWRPEYPSPTSFVGMVSQCPGSCSTACRHQVVCPEASDPIPTGSSDVVVANVAHAVFCPGGATLRGGITTSCTPAVAGSYARGTSPLAWRDACAMPSHSTFLTNSDDGTTVLGLPFTFRFYGSPFASLGIATNGMISFAVPTYSSVNTMLPTGDAPNTVFAFWDDVHNRTDGACVATFGTAPNREYIVQWNDQYFSGSSAPTSEHLTYQVVLTERTNTIDVLYHQMQGGTRAEGDSATVGIQQGTGSSFDLVGFNSPGATPAGRTIRWTPTTGTTSCSTGTYTRVYEGTTCSGTDAPYWGQYNFSSIVPAGTSITFRVRLSDTTTGLATAPWIGTSAAPLFRAPSAASSAPTSVDLGALTRVNAPTQFGADHRRFMEVEATLVPSADGTQAPTLVSTEVQFTCTTVDVPGCRPGGECFIGSDPCRIGRVECAATDAGFPLEVCVPHGNQPAGSVCGPGSVCNAAAACVACVEGAACDTGQACRAGRLACSTGTPVCVAASLRPAGTMCRPSAGVCDPAETCDGVRDACPADTLSAAFVVCRASTGVCDPGEYCTGATATCPANVFLPSATVCRSSMGVCDVAETCTGSSAACPADVFLPASSVCRAATGTCAVRTCTGSAAACPAGTGGTVEVCNNVDDDCDGRVDEDVTEACYSGPSGTAGVGVCHASQRSCAAGSWGSCIGEVIPTPEVCDALDNDCNGALNNGITCP